MMKMKCFIPVAVIVLVLCLCVCIPVNASSADSLKLYVDGKPVTYEAKVVDNRIYIPIMEIAGNLGISAEYDRTAGSVSLNSQDRAVTDIIKKVSPSVVGIIGKLKQSSLDYTQGGDNLEFGTGVIYKAEGYIITNAHVVKDMENIVVVLPNSKSYLARLKALDEKLDLAVVKIDKGGLTPAVFGNIADVEVGEPVIAIGTPLSFSLRNSATKGIISGINRSADGENKFIQSDAAINGGNSGGPLVNMKGEVIGINSIKYIGFGVEGMSFSIPVDTVKYAIKHFEAYGRVRTPYLGVAFSESVAARYGIPSNDGLAIILIEKDSPAERANLKIDDEVNAVNNVQIRTKLDYNEEIKKYLPGDTVVLTVKRNGTSIRIKVTYGEKKL